MWFSSKQKRIQNREKGKTPFLRKAMPEKHRQRAVENNQKSSGMGWVLLLWGLFAGTLFYLFFFSSFILVEHENISGAEEIPLETLQKFVNNEIDGKVWGIFPKRAYPMISVSAIENHMRENFPLIADISVDQSFPSGLNIRITERKKIILWLSSETAYLVDEMGLTHDGTVATREEYKPYTLTLSDTSNKPVKEGDKVFGDNFGVFLIALHEMFPRQLNIRLEPHYVIVSQFSDELRAKTTEGWGVYFNTSLPIEKSLNTLKLLFDKELPEAKRVNLDYIDLRVENHIYYAFQGEVPSTEVTPSIVSDTKQEDNNQEKKKKK